MRDDLRKPEILKEIGKLRSAGMGFKGIAEHLATKFNLDPEPSKTTVRSAYKVYSTRRTEIIAGDEELKGEIRESILNTKNQLTKLNDIVWDIIDTTEKSENKLAAAKEILNHLRFQEQILNKLTQSFDTQTLNKIEVTKIVVNNLEQLERDGFIKVLNRPGKVIDLETLKEE